MTTDTIASRALTRALRRTFLGSDGGLLTDDLASALVAATIELFGNDTECSVDLNDMFGLRLYEPLLPLPVEDLDETIQEIARILHFEHDLFDLIFKVGRGGSEVASSPRGTATMMSDDGITVYEFTIDDGVYFFNVAEPDVCEMEWWFAHTADDLESRARSIEDARSMIGYDDDEHC